MSEQKTKLKTVKEIKFADRAYIDNAREQALRRLYWLEDKGQNLSPEAKKVQVETLHHVINLCKLASQKQTEMKVNIHLLLLDFFKAITEAGLVGNVKIGLHDLDYDIIRDEKILSRKIYIPGTLDDYFTFLIWLIKDILVGK
jgi:hypothetical protein